MNKIDNWQVFVLLLNKIAIAKGLTQDQIALAIGKKQSHVSRFFSLSVCPTLHTFIQIAKVVGVNFFFEDKAGTTDLSMLFEQAMTELGRRPDDRLNN